MQLIMPYVNANLPVYPHSIRACPAADFGFFGLLVRLSKKRYNELFGNLRFFRTFTMKT